MASHAPSRRGAVLDFLPERQPGRTPFLLFAPKAVAVQGGRLLAEIRVEMQKQVFRNFVYDLFGRLRSPRKRVLAKRQIEILRILLDAGELSPNELVDQIRPSYTGLKNDRTAFLRDMDTLFNLGAIRNLEKGKNAFVASVNLDWPTQITETEFLRRIKELPKSKTRSGFTLE